MDVDTGKRNDAITQDLLDALGRFRRLHFMRHQPVPDLSPAEIRMLFSVAKALADRGPEGERSASAGDCDCPGAKVSEIGAFLQVAPPTVTQQITELESRGYVERSMDPHDRRAVRVSLTEKGTDAVQRAHMAFRQAFRGLVDHLGEEESRQLADLLHKTFVYFSEARDADYGRSTTDDRRP